MSGRTPPGPFAWPPDVHKRSQDTIPTIFGCKKAILQKCLFSLKNKGFLRVGWPSCGVFFPLRPPPRAIWTGISSCDPWETPLPHSTKNKKKRVFCFFFSLLSFLCFLPSALEAARGPPRGRDGREKGWPPSGGLIWGPLAASFGVYFLFFLLSSLFALLSSLFSLSSWSCEASIP